MEPRERREELDYLNAICCLLVILIHVLSIAVAGYEKGSWRLAVTFFPWQLASVAVPAFLFCGAVKMALQIRSDSLPAYPAYLGRRVTRIYLPYLAATLVYVLTYAALGLLRFDGGQLLEDLLLGNAASHFYYVILVMQFYLLMPLWKRVPALPSFLCLPAAAMVSLLMLQAPFVLSELGVTLLYTDRMFVTYLFYWVAGLYVGSSYERVCRELLRHKRCTLLSLPLVLLLAVIAYLQYVGGRNLYDTGLLKLFADMLSIFALLTLCLLIRRSSAEGLKRGLRFLHSASFFTYLYHCLFLELATNAAQEAGLISIGKLVYLRTVVCYTVPFLLYFVFGRIRAWIRGSRKNGGVRA